MTEKSTSVQQPSVALPADDPLRKLATARPYTDQKISYLGVVEDTYTIGLTGKDTAGRFA